VGICDGEMMACPQTEQKLLVAGISTEHDGHCIDIAA